MKNTNTTEAAEMALSAFENEILAFPVSDEDRQPKALLNAYHNAFIYAEGSQSNGYSVSANELRREILGLARSMGYTLEVN